MTNYKKITSKKITSNEDSLFSSAIFMLAKEQGTEELEKYKNTEAESGELQDILLPDEPEFLKRQWRRRRNAVLKRRILLAAGSVACVAVLLTYSLSAGLFSPTPEESDFFQELILENMFVYAESQEYPFGSDRQIVLPDSKLDWGKGNIAIYGSIIGVDNPDITHLTYRTESGRLFSSLKTETEDSPHEVSFGYYENYWQDLKWVGNPDEVFAATEMEDPDFSLVKPDTLTVSIAMKGGIQYEIKISMSYTPDGRVQAEIEDWTEHV